MRRSLLPLLALVAALCALVPASAGAATVDVNTTLDDFGPNGTCSLREAVEATNNDVPFGGCIGGSGVDVIVIPNGTYFLSIPGDEDLNAAGDLDIRDTEALTIVGTGAVAIRGGSTGDRVLHHTGSNAGPLEISNLTISGGNATGVNDGGGILNALGDLTLQSSTIQGNSAGVDGGGITNYATMTLRNVTVSGNSAYNDGGGIYGGGGSTTSLSNVTVAFNTTDVDVAGGGDGGGLGGSATSVFTLFNTLVGDNLDNSSTAEMDTNDCGVFGSVTASYSLFEAVDPVTCVGFTPETNVTGKDPRLQTLAFNGGTTRTNALREGSPAIDAGGPAGPGECLPLDQRGVARPQREGCDIGAFELPPAPPVFRCGGRVATVVGDSGRNVLRGTPGRDVIAGLGGTDTIRGLGGNDLLCGGKGNDSLFGNKGNDTLLGNEGNDILRSAEGRDVLKGGKKADRIFGGAGPDSLFGGAGKDRLVGGPGRDQLKGGAGRDNETE